MQIYLEETSLPLQICSLCFGRCENWDAFRTRCQANNTQLRLQYAELTWESETDGGGDPEECSPVPKKEGDDDTDSDSQEEEYKIMLEPADEESMDEEEGDGEGEEESYQAADCLEDEVCPLEVSSGSRSSSNNNNSDANQVILRASHVICVPNYFLSLCRCSSAKSVASTCGGCWPSASTRSNTRGI